MIEIHAGSREHIFEVLKCLAGLICYITARDFTGGRIDSDLARRENKAAVWIYDSLAVLTDCLRSFIGADDFFN